MTALSGTIPEPEQYRQLSLLPSHTHDFIFHFPAIPVTLGITGLALAMFATL